MAVSKDIRTSEAWKITEMVAGLPEEDVAQVNPQGDDLANPSAARIKQLALEKRQDYIAENEEISMKKASFRVVLIAAVICLVSLSAFAAFGGLEYIQGIFGESAGTIENAIVTPQVVASGEGRDLALEALVTDGYVTNMVVSLSGDRPSEEVPLFDVSVDAPLCSSNWYVLEEFSTPDKTYYAIETISEERFDTASMVISLDEGIAPITMSFDVENKLGNAVVDFPDGAMSGQTELKQLQISSMGFMLIGHEQSVQGGLPATSIQLLFADGRGESMDVEFAPSDETVGGGGGAIIGGGDEIPPLVTGFQGMRNDDGELVINGKFSRIIDPSGIEKIVVDGVEYPVQ